MRANDIAKLTFREESRNLYFEYINETLVFEEGIQF
jgi:hypothetical protein